METTMSLVIDENRIKGMLTWNTTIISEASYPDDKTRLNQAQNGADTSPALKNAQEMERRIDSVIRELLHAAGTSPQDVTTVLLGVDFLRLFDLAGWIRPSVTYLRCSPIGIIHPPLHTSPLAELIQTQIIWNKDEYLQALDAAYRSFSPSVAINAPLMTRMESDSIWEISRTPAGEKSDRHPFINQGTDFAQIGYETRENLLLVNSLLRPGVQSFYGSLEQCLAKHHLSSKIFTLMGNGELQIKNKICRYPIYTSGSLKSLSILAARSILDGGNAVVIFPAAPGWQIGLMENGLINTVPSSIEFNRVPLLLSQPVTAGFQFNSHSVSQSLQDLSALLTSINPLERSFPVVIIPAENEEPKDQIADQALRETCRSLYGKIYVLKKPREIGILNAALSFHKQVYINSSQNRTFGKWREAQWELLREEMAEEGYQVSFRFKSEASGAVECSGAAVTFRNMRGNEKQVWWNSFWEEHTIRYLPRHGVAIRFGLHGPIF